MPGRRRRAAPGRSRCVSFGYHAAGDQRIGRGRVVYKLPSSRIGGGGEDDAAWSAIDSRTQRPVRDLDPVGTRQGIGCVACHAAVGPVDAHVNRPRNRGNYEGNASWTSFETGAQFFDRPEEVTRAFGHRKQRLPGSTAHRFFSLVQMTMAMFIAKNRPARLGMRDRAKRAAHVTMYVCSAATFLARPSGASTSNACATCTANGALGRTPSSPRTRACDLSRLPHEPLPRCLRARPCDRWRRTKRMSKWYPLRIQTTRRARTRLRRSVVGR